MVTVRRGGSLNDDDHRLFALWAADCAFHVLHLFESTYPGDRRTRDTIELARAWGRGELTMKAARSGAFASQAAREATGAAKLAALSASQAVVVSHVPSHNLGAAAYAIRAAQEAADTSAGEEAGRRECAWQRSKIPAHLRTLVLEDQRRRNPICWNVFM